MVDSHCHLADEVFVPDLDDVIGRARSAGLSSALVILDAGNAEEAGRAATVAAKWPAVRFATGVHPHHAARHETGAAGAAAIVAASLAAQPSARALGEMGLDYHYDFAPREVQRQVFAAQVELAVERNLPVVIHTREADEDTLAVLREAGQGRVRGVFHCFTGDMALGRAALDLGFHLSFSGIVTFPRAQNLRDVAKAAPLDRLLIETDSPFLAPVPHRGKRNEPAWVPRVAEALSEARGVPVEALAEATTSNFEGLFGAVEPAA